MKPNVRDLRNLIENTHRVWRLGSNVDRQAKFNSLASRLVGMFNPREIPCSFSDSDGFRTSADLDTPLPSDLLPLYYLLEQEAQASKPTFLKMFVVQPNA